jgi:hypothetical protein
MFISELSVGSHLISVYWGKKGSRPPQSFVLHLPVKMMSPKKRVLGTYLELAEDAWPGQDINAPLIQAQLVDILCPWRGKS